METNDLKAARNWEPVIRRMELLMRLKSFPVAFKMLENKEDIDKVPFMRRLSHKATMCQLTNLVRNFDWTVGATAEEFISVMCPSIIGLAKLPEFMTDGTFRSIVWAKSRADGKKYENGIPRIPTGKYEAVIMAPLVYNPFEPDIVLIYANPAQMMLLINALQFEDYEVMQFFCVGESSCSDAIARCYNTGKPSLTIPCYGERRYGHAQDDELVMALPVGLMDKALAGLESLYKRGIRYPISYAGAEADVTAAFPAAYGAEAMVAALRGNKRRLLLGVTGSIATGKSTVAKMLEEKGAFTIDFDVLSRVVVEPGTQGYNDIVAYFGEQVLQEDKTLDRDKLREIVFSDMEKRKRLEGFTHPRIGEEFFKLVEEYTAKDPEAIIQVVIPLLIEINMQGMFDNLLMVYAPEDTQLKRLIERDGNSEDLAKSIIKSQMHVDDKKGYCDLLVDNSESLEKTQAQVDALWDKLKAIQKERIAEVEKQK
ncbi:dephospho-CoA kinase [Desulfatibacillum alkenivorans DSM 16219]|jgi:dephospho-CoA kinase|uniref:Dephospho-CoA kinase n=1 Tax=Desulfatibacillum alkenivorans DSM 16219 TaxID=1121393 RepID=A0A1M6P2A3_9BACT|nr:dephospho-CoA kinase [Desulfatibacillum alkenivorans]SHK02099.1 dephospho-CoA kinase [Desulfatibacillum alkenivorans DSM 16219]